MIICYLVFGHNQSIKGLSSDNFLSISVYFREISLVRWVYCIASLANFCSIHLLTDFITNNFVMSYIIV